MPTLAQTPKTVVCMLVGDIATFTVFWHLAETRVWKQSGMDKRHDLLPPLTF